MSGFGSGGTLKHFAGARPCARYKGREDSSQQSKAPADISARTSTSLSTATMQTALSSPDLIELCLTSIGPRGGYGDDELREIERSLASVLRGPMARSRAQGLAELAFYLETQMGATTAARQILSLVGAALAASSPAADRFVASTGSSRSPWPAQPHSNVSSESTGSAGVSLVDLRSLNAKQGEKP